jgi:hypothetical protein
VALAGSAAGSLYGEAGLTSDDEDYGGGKFGMSRESEPLLTGLRLRCILIFSFEI